MRGKLKIAVTLLLCVTLILVSVPAVVPEAEAAGTYTPPFTTVRIGLYTYESSGNISERNFPSNNLQNVSGKGYGYEFGYYDDNRSFVSLGATVTDTDEITVMMDKNMVYNATTNAYAEGTQGGAVVGCYHLRLGDTYRDYASAKAKADTLTGGFVRYRSGTFYVLMGQYLNADEAALAASASPYSVTSDSGSSYTVTVVQTKTNRILFEFDCGANESLAVRPLAQNGVKAQTWHRKCMYFGGFAFLRKTGGNITVVNYVDIEDYVKGVVCYEMSPSWPLEALKAQAITARTYIMDHTSKHKSEGFEICNTIHCQAYHGTERATSNSDAAVDQTRSQYLTYQGKICDTYYASSDGGATENSENIWNIAYPYCRGVFDPYEADVASSISNYYWTKTYTPSTLGAQLRSKGFDSSDVVQVSITFTDMGNVYSITFTDRNGVKNTVSKSSCRTVIGSNLSNRYTVNGLTSNAAAGLYVNNGALLDGGLDGAWALGGGGAAAQLPSGDIYAISGKGTVSKVGDGSAGTAAASGKTVTTGVNASGNFVFSGSGHGHNVGMSQWGAYSMARYHNKTCAEILTFYYTGTQVITAPRPGE